MLVSARMRKGTLCLLALTLISLLGADISHTAPSPLSGSETFTRSDLNLGTLFPISIVRRYNSNSGYDSPSGYGWAHNYDKRLYTYADGSVVIRKETGWKRRFTPSGGGFTTPVGETGTLSANPDQSFTYTEKDGTKEQYDPKGRLASISDPKGNALILSYESSTRFSLWGLLPWNVNQTNPLKVAYDYHLSRIEERNSSGTPTGAWVTFQYDSASGRLTGLSDSLGRTVTYGYDAIGNLTSVTTPLSTAAYGYTDPTNKHLLTSINEGDGPYTNTYNAQGKVTKQTHGTGVIDIEYTIPRQKTKVTTSIKDGSGALLNTATRTVEFDTLGQVIKETDTLGNETRFTRNDKTWITSKAQWENIGTVSSPSLLLRTTTSYTYDPLGNQLTRTEASGTPLEKTTIYTYDPIFNRQLTETAKSVVNPAQNRITTNAYDATGNLTGTTETGLLGDGTPYSYTTTYQYNANGRMTSIDGSRTDVQDVTTNTYDTLGNLLGKTEALIGTTTYANYDGQGNPGSITDPNGNTTSYSYDTAGRVLTVTGPGDTAATQYGYTTGGCGSCGGGPSNRIDHIILPEGNRIDYYYDANGKQNRIADSQGNGITYSYDSEGNKLKEDIKDLGGTLQKTLSYQYDALNRLKQIKNPDATFTEYSYDGLGNRISTRDPKTNSTSYQYDTLNRLTATIQPGSVTTGFGYDSNSNQTSVADPNTNTTTYKFDDMGRVYQTVSPDTGSTTYSYDPAGNLKTKTDANGITTSYSYDAANRLTKIDFPTDTDTTYVYDTCLNGKGRICTLTDASGTTSYEYTNKGQIAKETRTIDGTAYVTQYTYDMNGNIRTMTYPSGRVITYAYTDNKPVSVLNNAANLATNITYKPFGGIIGLTYGNALTGTIGYDNQYRIASITAGTVMNLTYTDDANGNITAIANILDSTKSKAFTYDAIDRLATATSTGIWGSLAWTYDGVGNRKTEGANSYSYQPNSNKLTSANGKAFGYDNNGNTTTENTRQYTYNQNQRLIQVVDGAMTAGYTYNANGQRVKKQVNGTITIFHYSQSGQIIAESNSAGVTTAEYVYLNGQPLAKMDATGTSYYNNDHLGTPQKLTDSTGAVVWNAGYKPFGEATITGTVTNNLRFPGQYFDSETGLHYNYRRDYNPQVGRYIQADPLGIMKGENYLYAYVSNAPVNVSDFNGLWPGSGVGPEACDYYSKLCDKKTKCGDDKYACDTKKCCESFGNGSITNNQAVMT